MLHYLPCFGIILIIAVVCKGSDPFTLSAVSNSMIGHELYWRVRNENPRTLEPLALDPDTKSKICHHITGSSYFSHVLGEERVCVHNIYNRLQSQRFPLLDIKEEQIPKRVSDEDTPPPIYDNPDKLVDTIISDDEEDYNKTVQEYVFVCLTYNKAEEGESVYLISREYNLGDTPNPYIPGRFVFAYFENDDKEIQVEIHSIAEEPAKSLFSSSREVEYWYVKNRAGFKPVKEESEDPICNLDPLERLRVCTQVLSSAYFAGELKFVPTKEYIDESKCTKRNIWLQDEKLRTVMMGEQYEEWMISCRPKEYYSVFQAEYFLSRVYGFNNEVFVYRRGGYRPRTVILENLFSNVRFRI